MNKYLVPVPLLALMMACASVKGSGKYATPVNGVVEQSSFSSDPKAPYELPNEKKLTTKSGLLVSGSENTSLASDYFTLIDLTFENKSSDWLRVTKVGIDFGDATTNSEVRFPVGQDLMDWAQSAKEVKAIRDYNMQVALGVAAGAGTAVAAGGAGGSQSAGVGVVAGSSMALAASNLSNILDSLQRARVIPEDHLLAGGFSVPPGLHKKKWLTLYAKSPLQVPFIEKVAITLTYDNGVSESVMLPLRNVLTSYSKFQKNHPQTAAAKRAAEQKSLSN